MTNTKSNKPFVYLLFIFVAPLLLSWLLFYYHQYFTFNTTNHGELIRPSLKISQISSLSANAHTWKIIHVEPLRCGQTCQHVNFQLGQIKKALGKDGSRVDVISFPHDAALHAQKNEAIYLSDPIGNVFMSYADTTNPMYVLKDLKKVLEVSQIG